ncbi:MAG: hypothetical protein OXD30_06740 [Bryobacterales bacterium]|nr:hypothetical protein [Bryobacterales bacterium]
MPVPEQPLDFDIIHQMAAIDRGMGWKQPRCRKLAAWSTVIAP